MVEAKRGSGTRKEAPYIADVMALVQAAQARGSLCVFYRAGHQALDERCVDYFAVGPFDIHEASWREVERCGLAAAADRLNAVVGGEGGRAGYISYEMGFACEKPWSGLRLPQSGYAWRFAQVRCWYEVDHAARRAAIVTAGEDWEESVGALDGLIGSVAASNRQSEGAVSGNHLLSTEQAAQCGEWDEVAYGVQVGKILADIAAGRYYELNYTQQFRVASGRNPADTFTTLFRGYSPQRGFFCQFPDEVIGFASPELFLKKQGQRLYTRPIKGSFQPGSPVIGHEKLMAEHIMVVDLARNDLGRLSDLAPVVVPQLRVERGYGGLRHWESLIAGKTSHDWGLIMAATLPAASITGAPKVEVVRAIAEYEKSPRGVYTGACGWFWPGGNFDLNVAIRGFCASPAAAAGVWEYQVGAGGAIVADSDAVAEYNEALAKALPVLSAIVSAE